MRRGSLQAFFEQWAPHITGIATEAPGGLTPQQIAQRAEAVKAAGKKRVIVAGSNGRLGRAVKFALSAQGHLVTSISRHSSRFYPMDLDHRQWWEVAAEKGLPECDAIVQVTGANIMDSPLTKERLSELYDSRVGVTKLLHSRAKFLKEAPKVFVHASCVGYYPANTDQVFTDKYDGPPSNDFYGEMCHDMEEQARTLFGKDMRVVHVRLGHIMDSDGLLDTAFKLHPLGKRFAGHFGNGKQWFPWIHFADATDIMIRAVEEDRIKGVVNAVAPGVIQQRDLGRVMRACLTEPNPSVYPIPKFVARYWFTDRAFYLLDSRRVLNSPVLDEHVNFKFRYPTIDKALMDLWPDLRGYEYTIPPPLDTSMPLV